MRFTRHAAIGLVAAVAATSLFGAATASGAVDPLVGRWTFSGGVVTITASGAGFQGTVTKKTSFGECPHLAGELMWKSLVARQDGQYWGRHQYEWWTQDVHGTKTCVPPRPDKFGNIAMRILQSGSQRTLKVCFAPPEQPAVQPSIAPDGTATSAPDGCITSDPSGSVPPPPGFSDVFRLPSTRSCPLNRSKLLMVGVRDPALTPLASVSVALNGRTVNSARRNAGLMVAALAVRGVPRRRAFTVTATAVTVLGQRVAGTRRYRAPSSFRRCA